MLIETGTWPVENRTHHSRLTFYHNLTHSEEERDARKVIIEMIYKYIENSWWEEIRRVGTKYGIDTNIDYVSIKEVHV